MIPSQAKLRLGTRGSRLALAQANNVKALLEREYDSLEVEIVPITTSGDKGNREILGSFVRDIQYALLDNRIDAALHCLKDLPTEPLDGLVLAAHMEREDSRDALIGPAESISALPIGSHVGTGSVRRTSQLAAVRKDLTFSPLVGNIDTRLRKLTEGQHDAIILAIAGLKRLGLLDTWSADHPGINVTPLNIDEMLPAPGQAVLVLETRADDKSAQDIVVSLHDEFTCRCATAERAFLSAFGGGCSVPIGAFATWHKGAIHLSGLVAAPDGSQVLRGTATAEDAVEVANMLVGEMRGQGAFEVFKRAPIATGGGE